MATDGPIGPCSVGNGIEVGIDICLKGDGIPRTVEEGKVERQMQAGFVPSIEVADAVRLALDLAAQQAFVELVDDLPKIGEIGHRLWAVIGKDVFEALGRRLAFIGLRVARIVAKKLILCE